MSNFRYYDKPEYTRDLAKQAVSSKGKLAHRGATMWLRGLQRVRTKEEIERDSPKEFTARKRYMDQVEVVERTIATLSNTARDTFKAFKKGMPEKARFFPRETAPTLLRHYPHLGLCQFAEVPLSLPEVGDCIVALYYANFFAVGSVKSEEEFLTLKSPEYGNMYFAVAWREDPETGGYVLAENFGNNGLMFRTRSQQTAFDSSFHLSTGVSVDTFKKRHDAALRRLDALKDRPKALGTR